MPRLSILLPTYNGAAYLRPQIESILSQTDPDFELVAVDDGSRDDTISILDEFARRDRRVRRLPSTGNEGQRLRLRQLLQSVSTDFVAFADQDDVWHPDRNALLFAAIGDRALAFGRSQLIDGGGRRLGPTILDLLHVNPHTAGPLGTLFRPLIAAHATIARRDWIDPAVFSGPGNFDWVMSVEALLSRGLIYVDEAVVMHRLHGGNQNNGGVVKAPSKLISRQQLLRSTSFIRTGRFYFFATIDQLSRSSALSGDTRRIFEQAAHACRYAWYQPLDFSFGKGGRLEKELHRLLDPFASSAEDLAFFTVRLAAIVRPVFAPSNVRRAVAVYRGTSD